MTKIIELILTETRVGLGKENDPVRILRQLWTKDGKLVVEEKDEYDANRLVIVNFDKII